MKNQNMKTICHTTQRTKEEKKKLLIRLRTIEGQIRGIQNMVEDFNASFSCF